MTLIVHIHYVAMLRERTGMREESLTTEAESIEQLYGEIADKHKLPWPNVSFRPAVNDRICDWSTRLSDRDQVLFLPPSSGG